MEPGVIFGLLFDHGLVKHEFKLLSLVLLGLVVSENVKQAPVAHFFVDIQDDWGQVGRFLAVVVASWLGFSNRRPWSVLRLFSGELRCRINNLAIPLGFSWLCLLFEVLLDDVLEAAVLTLKASHLLSHLLLLIPQLLFSQEQIFSEQLVFFLQIRNLSVHNLLQLVHLALHLGQFGG